MFSLVKQINRLVEEACKSWSIVEGTAEGVCGVYRVLVVPLASRMLRKVFDRDPEEILKLAEREFKLLKKKGKWMKGKKVFLSGKKLGELLGSYLAGFKKCREKKGKGVVVCLWRVKKSDNPYCTD